MVKDKEFKEGHARVQWIFALLANVTLFIFGLECGWISPTIKILRSDQSPTGYPLSDGMVGWIASGGSIAAIFSVFIYSYIADTYGRRIGVILIAFTLAISWIIKLSYCSATFLIIARMFSGLASGGCFTIVPMYVKEISQDEIRGILGSFSGLMQNVGMFLMYFMGAYLDYYTVIKMVLGLAIVIAFLLFKIPESPEFLVKQGKFDEAAKNVAFFRGLNKDDKIVHSIVETMKNEDAHFKSLPNLTISRILKEKSWRRGFILITTTFLLSGLGGVIAIINFASTILKSTGSKSAVSPEIQLLSLPCVIIIGSLSLALTVERYGRKIILFVSFLISACSMATIAVLLIAQEHGSNIPSWLILLAIAISAVMFGAGTAAVPNIILTEMFNFQVRAKVMGMVITFSFFLTFLQIITYPFMVNTMGQSSPFIIYAIISLSGAIFTIIFLPETKGKSEAEILHLLDSGSTKNSLMEQESK